MTDRTPKPCRHPRAAHRHGTYLAYDKDDCRCWPCIRAAAVRGAAERKMAATGTSSYVPADRAREHVRQLLDVMTIYQLEQRAGVNRTAVRVLVGQAPGRPASRRITRAHEAALLAVTADWLGDEEHGHVDGTGTRRRVRALVALGWPVKQLGDRLAWSSRTCWYLTSPTFHEAAPVRAATRNAVRVLYDELSLTVPPASRAATYARHRAAERGWLPPLAWDDDTIDDPDVFPDLDGQDDDVDEWAVEQVCGGTRMRLSGRDLDAAVLRMTDARVPNAEIAHRLFIDERQVYRIRQRAQTRQEAA